GGVLSQDSSLGGVLEAEEEGRKKSTEKSTTNTTAAAAFSALQLDQPFGSKAFQSAWCRAYDSMNGHGFADAMEKCIEDCQGRKIKIPGRWFTVKREVEKLEAKSMYHQTPL